MKAWLLITNPENWNVILNNDIMGIPSHQKNLKKKIAIGDKILIYITKISSFGGIYEVLEKDNIKPIKWNTGNYPNLIKITPVKIFKSPISIKDKIHKLKFIKNPPHWNVCVWREKEIPLDDIDYMMGFE